MDTPDKAPEVQISAQAQPASSGSQPDHSSAVPPELPSQSPPDASPPTMSESANKNEKSNAGIIWAVVVIVGLIVLVAIFGSGSGSGSSTSSSSGNGSSSGGGGGYTPAPAYIPPVSKALDEKNGFKDFKFGMTLDEARAVLAPTQVNQNPGAKEEVFLYSGTAVNRIGEFATDALGLRFFEGRLFRIDIRLSSFQNEIFEALKINYGEPFDNTDWKRGTDALKAKCWMGEKTYAAIVAPTYGAWDAVIIYDQVANQKAREYAEKEPERAAKDFSTNGFKSLTMGTRLDELPAAFYTVSDNNEATGIKKIVINRGDLLTIGYYPLRYVSCEFFKNRLYRIDLSLEENRKEIFQTIQKRFGLLQKNDSWTRGSEKLTGKSAGDNNFHLTILAPGGVYGGEEWDLIVLMDYSIQQEAEQFKQDSAKEAAKEFSANGFKSLTMGMSLKSLTVAYTVTENSEVTGVKKVSISRGELLRVGAFPLRYVNCEFFKDQLYRIDLELSENRKEIFKIFENRFTPLQKNDTWTQGTVRLSAKSGGSERFFGTILAPGSAYSGEEWETIVLLDTALQRKRHACDLLTEQRQ